MRKANRRRRLRHELTCFLRIDGHIGVKTWYYLLALDADRDVNEGLAG